MIAITVASVRFAFSFKSSGPQATPSLQPKASASVHLGSTVADDPPLPLEPPEELPPEPPEELPPLDEEPAKMLTFIVLTTLSEVAPNVAVILTSFSYPKAVFTVLVNFSELELVSQ